jgi:transposase InsO family protein
MSERAKFIFALQDGVFSMTELCRRFGISRKTGYKWRRRFEDGGLPALADRSRAPHHCPHRTPETVQAMILAFRDEKPGWGPRKIRRCLQKRHPQIDWPARSTIYQILKEAGRITPRRRRRRHRHPGTSPIHSDRPGAVWTADFKGEFRLQNGRYCYPLTIQDAFSRYLLACEALEAPSVESTAPVFERVFQAYGCPAAIRTDNGAPFACSRALGGLTQLNQQWVRLGIEHQRIRPGCPQDNGRHERMHRTLKAYATRPPEATFADQQRRFDAFCHEFNTIRPHESLDDRVPAEMFAPCPHPMPTALAEVWYPGHYERRKVSRNGTIRMKGWQVFISSVLVGEYVGLVEVDDGIWSLFYADRLLARINLPARTIHPGTP